ncbi:MAG: head decoration protein [Pseudomonadota bacterium]
MAPVDMTAREFAFVVSEANGYRSRAAGVVTVPANTTFEAGLVLGQQTTGLKYVRHDTDGTNDGRRTEAALLSKTLKNDTASAADYNVTVIVRDCEVDGNQLTYEAGADAAAITASNTALASLGIIVKEAT